MPACWCRREWTRNLDWKQHFNVHTDDATARSQKSPPKLLYANQSINNHSILENVNQSIVSIKQGHIRLLLCSNTIWVYRPLCLLNQYPNFGVRLPISNWTRRLAERKFDNQREFPLLQYHFSLSGCRWEKRLKFHRLVRRWLLMDTLIHLAAIVFV